MKPELYIARRYLVARKSLGVIHTISAISAIGMAVGTAALILILSVFNGFNRVIEENLSDLAPDVLVTAAHGKYFVPEGPAFDALSDEPGVVRICSVLEEQVFVSYAGREGLARAKGVDGTYERESGLQAGRPTAFHRPACPVLSPPGRPHPPRRARRGPGQRAALPFLPAERERHRG